MIRVEGLHRTEAPRRLVLAFMASLAGAARMSFDLYFGALEAHLMRDPFNGIGD